MGTEFGGVPATARASSLSRGTATAASPNCARPRSRFGLSGFGARAPAFCAAYMSAYYSLLVAVILDLILHLAGGDIDDQLAELHRVAAGV